MSVFEIFVVLIFPYSDWIQRDTPYSVQMLQKNGPEKLRIWTLFTQCVLWLSLHVFSTNVLDIKLVFTKEKFPRIPLQRFAKNLIIFPDFVFWKFINSYFQITIHKTIIWYVKNLWEPSASFISSILKKLQVCSPQIIFKLRVKATKNSCSKNCWIQ